MKIYGPKGGGPPTVKRICPLCAGVWISSPDTTCDCLVCKIRIWPLSEMSLASQKKVRQLELGRIRRGTIHRVK